MMSHKQNKHLNDIFDSVAVALSKNPVRYN